MEIGRVILLCDCSHAIMRDESRLSALDKVVARLIETLNERSKIKAVNTAVVEYDTVSTSNDLAKINVRRYMVTPGTPIEYAPSRSGLFKGNSPLGKAIGRAVELLEKIPSTDGNTKDIVFLIAACAGTGEPSFDDAFRAADSNSKEFHDSRRIVITVNARGDTISTLSHFATPDGTGRPYMHKTSENIDFMRLLS